MNPQKPKVSNASQVFFFIFFAAILTSVALTYIEKEVRHNFVSFTDEEEIPDPTDFYVRIYENVLNFVNQGSTN